MYRNSDGDSIDDLRQKIRELEQALARSVELNRKLTKQRTVKVFKLFLACVLVVGVLCFVMGFFSLKNAQLEAARISEGVANARRKVERKRQAAKKKADVEAAKAKLEADNKAAREFNDKTRKALFEGADQWIKKHASGNGDAYCYLSEFEKKPVDGVQPRVDDGSLYSCDVLREDAPIIKILCCPSVKKCYKVQP